ncbi:MAG: UDP-2,4-diacetamido-2,4,6-trideoxy-beta-L-altropyranose hydrolase [Bacteroidia bacterium]|nr:UDP-2,4-diacetamido-2,4,6-trideoxy-beta-L-altropyranose hydrolase [Bacteroidia bacterium]
MKSKIFIRADGSLRLGLGHLVRCTALAHMLKTDFDILFFCIEIPESIGKELVENNFELIKIENETQFIEQINSQQIVILDGYHFNLAFQKQVKAKGCKLVCIDDQHNMEFVADLIINHAPGITPLDYKAQPYTQFALGIEFALLRPSFLEQTAKMRVIENMESVFICFGGSDYYNLTESTLRVVLAFDRFKKVIIVTGSAYSHFRSLKELINDNEIVVSYQDVNSKQMVSLINESSLAIVPSSSILFELIAVGIPAITGFYVDNQKEAAQSICEMGLAFNCENMLINYSEKLNFHLHRISCLNGNQMVQKQKAIIWKGPQFYLELFKSI